MSNTQFCLPLNAFASVKVLRADIKRWKNATIRSRNRCANENGNQGGTGRGTWVTYRKSATWNSLILHTEQEIFPGIVPWVTAVEKPPLRHLRLHRHHHYTTTYRQHIHANTDATPFLHVAAAAKVMPFLAEFGPFMNALPSYFHAILARSVCENVRLHQAKHYMRRIDSRFR